MRPVLHAHCPRARVRRAVRTPCQIVRDRDFRLVGSRVLDVSVRGMLVEATAPILTGEELVVSFRGPSSSRWYDCGGTVARVVHGRRPGDPDLALGVAFEGLGPLDQMFLCDELCRAPLAASRKTPRWERRRATLFGGP